MKQNRSLLSSLAVCGLALAVASTALAQTSGTATVIRIKGSARYSEGAGNWKPLKNGATLKPGTVIQTDMSKDSYVDIVLGDGSGKGVAAMSFASAAGAGAGAAGATYAPAVQQNVVRIWENTVLGVDKLSAMNTGADLVTDTQLDLKAGHITGIVKKMSAASKYEIKLPNGVAGIRGTIYTLWANGASSVRAGSMVLSLVKPGSSDVQTEVLNTDEQFDPATGKSPLSASQRTSFDQLIPQVQAQTAFNNLNQPIDQTIQPVSPHEKGKGKGKGKGQNW